MELQNPEIENIHLPVVPPKLVLLVLGALSFLGALLGSGIIYMMSEVQGIDMKEAIGSFGPDSPIEWRNFMRGILLLNHLTSFLLPALLTGWLFYRRNWAHLLSLQARPKAAKLVLGVFFVMTAFPLAQIAIGANIWLVERINWLKPLVEMESDTGQLVEGLLVMTSPWELFFSLVVIGLVPAIGEEMVFRGLLQQSLMRWVKRPTIAIILTALLFSLIHLQVQRFLAIFLLGLVLGLLFYWTKNLWICIAAHFLNNAMQVVVAWFYQDKVAELNQADAGDISWGLSLPALLLVLLIGFQLQKSVGSKQVGL